MHTESFSCLERFLRHPLLTEHASRKIGNLNVHKCMCPPTMHTHARGAERENLISYKAFSNIQAVNMKEKEAQKLSLLGGEKN